MGVPPMLKCDAMANPIIRDIPDSFETERLLIRVPQAGDGPALNAAIRETFENLKPWMPWAQEMPSIDPLSD
jgi:hypothetical protein